MQSLRATGGELERALAAEQKRLKDVQQTARRRQENDAEKAKELLAQIAASDADGAREKAERLRAEARTAEVVEELLAERATVEDHEKVIAAHLRTIEETRGIRTRERWAYTLGLHPGPTHWAYTLGLHPGPTPWAYTLGLYWGVWRRGVCLSVWAPWPAAAEGCGSSLFCCPHEHTSDACHEHTSDACHEHTSGACHEHTSGACC